MTDTSHTLAFPTQATTTREQMSDDELMFQTRLALVQSLARCQSDPDELNAIYKDIANFNVLARNNGFFEYVIEEEF